MKVRDIVDTLQMNYLPDDDLQISEIVGWLNHSLALNWSDDVAKVRDLLLKTGE